MDQRIARLLGLDLNDPDVVAAIAKAEREAAVDRRQHIDADRRPRHTGPEMTAAPDGEPGRATPEH
ncbi:hypothetical protein [Streptacidiphilus rugosus]|uniref:hypothetical protein n=1 Tax=Streptacidiphilus rugosus TaxID=405783 RepID=UPI000B25DB28|nr:hypothetical protein [Streptacidiphilus rugosus]